MSDGALWSQARQEGLVAMAVYSNFDKARNVTFLAYLKDWGKSYGELLEFLDGLHMPCCCSPEHDADTFTEEDVRKWVASHTDKDTGRVSEEAIKAGIPQVGQQKKDHVHVLLCANGPMTAPYFADLISDFHEVTSFQKVNSVPSMIRYFAHMDSPEKHQYSPLQIHGFGGLDLSPIMKTSKVSNLTVLLDVLDYMMANDIRHYNKLVKWALSTGDIDTISCVTGRASFFANYFKAQSDERREKLEKKEREAKGIA